MVAQGTLVDNRFELLEPLGKGGFGVVYLARQPLLDRKVALKLIKISLADAEGVARFEREAKILAELKHPNIAMFIAYGRAQGCCYTALEYIPGEALNARLHRTRRIPPPLLKTFAQQILEALAHAHKHGVVHRDLKPANIIIHEDGHTIKLIDFGLARTQTSQALTQEGDVVGTVYYMSPEQCMAEEVDHRTDLYALGCILYECLTGVRAFVGQDHAAIMNSQLKESRRLRADGDGGFTRFINRLLEKDPEARFQTAQEALAELDRVRPELFIEATPEEVPKVKEEDGTHKTVRHRIILAAVAALLVCISAAMWSMTHHGTTTFDFGPRIRTEADGIEGVQLESILVDRLHKVDEAQRLLATAPPASVPVLQSQIESELYDLWTYALVRKLYTAAQIIQKRELQLPWPPNDLRIDAARHCHIVDKMDPAFESVATQAMALLAESTAEHDIDQMIQLHTMLIERFIRLRQPLRATQQGELLRTYATNMSDELNEQQKRSISGVLAAVTVR